MKKEIEMTQTSQELYDALLQARQEIQAENIFLERMSHEIRTPMNSIIGLTYLSKENIDNQKQVLENLDKIEKSAYFLRSFIDDILNLSLLESGRVADNKKRLRAGQEKNRSGFPWRHAEPCRKVIALTVKS